MIKAVEYTDSDDVKIIPVNWKVPTLIYKVYHSQEIWGLVLFEIQSHMHGKNKRGILAVPTSNNC